MKTVELLEKHPKTLSLLKEWWNKKIMEALKDKNIPSEFKGTMKDMDVQDYQIVKTIDGNPHTLFEFFDENEIYIKVDVHDEPLLFGSAFRENKLYYKFRTRKEAERDILDDAFEMLEEKL